MGEDKRYLVYLELMLLVVGMFSFPYVFSEAMFGESVVREIPSYPLNFRNTKEPSLAATVAQYPILIAESLGDVIDGVNYVVVSFVTQLAVPLFPLVSGQVEGCCEQTNGGSFCTVTDSSECRSDATFAAGSVCSTASFCQVGCCFDESTGIYEKNVLESQCTADWVADPFCNLPGAQLGCCVLGSNTKFETEGQCAVDSQIFALSEGYEIDWRTGMDELSCLRLASEQEEGACVLSNGDCSFGTQAECLQFGGEFAANLLCSAPALNTVCESTEETTCVPGRDGVYFIDSCGNVANIYDAGRVNDLNYWTHVIEPEDSCNAPNGAADSATCGNCNRFDGGICATAGSDSFDPAYGDYYCRNTECSFVDAWGENHEYSNGESWCVYNSPIGEGDDAPGSRHFRYICNAGEVQVEPCADYRNEICIQQDTLDTDAAGVTGEVEFSNAVCRKNNAKHCLDIGERSVQACNEEPDCMVRSVRVGGTFDFDICVPEYPEGFSFDEQYQTTGAQVCSVNTRTCVVSFAPLPFCVCVDNCGCLDAASFNAQMDEVCTSLGDCGNAPGYNDVQPTRGLVADYDSRVQKYMLAAGLGPGDYLGVGSSLFEQSAFSSSIFSSKLDPQKPEIPSNTAPPSQFGSILATLGGLLAAISGVLGSTMLAIGGLMMSMLGSLFAAASPTVCPPILVPYTCDLWQPPAGGSACGVCNENSDEPCTKYSCRSLGAACEFINEGTDNELCVAAEDDGGFPVVTPILDLNEIIDSNNLYEFPDLLAFIQEVDYTLLAPNHIEITNVNGGCVDAYSPVPIQFDTHEPAQCKFDIKDVTFEEMAYFVGSSAYVYNHSTFFQIPDPSHGVAQNYTSETDTSIYIKCRDRYGHETPEYLQIDMCVYDGPDETAPLIVNTRPKTDSIVSYDSDSFSLQVLTNELATCRYSMSDVDYLAMTNEFSCDDSFSNPSQPIGYVCSANVSLGSSNSSSSVYYIRCADQPWLIDTVEEVNRNSNSQGYAFEVRRPTAKIAIESIEPTGELITVADRLTLDLSVETSGGGDIHVCSYSFSGYDTMIDFLDTGSAGVHSQQLSLGSNSFTAYVECADETGDVAREQTSFRVFQKQSSPLISRAWQQDSTLYFVTQEEAECRYSENSCSFIFTNGTSVSGDGITHRLVARTGKSYYVKCEDSLGNLPAGCSAVLSAA